MVAFNLLRDAFGCLVQIRRAPLLPVQPSLRQQLLDPTLQASRPLSAKVGHERGRESSWERARSHSEVQLNGDAQCRVPFARLRCFGKDSRPISRHVRWQSCVVSQEAHFAPNWMPLSSAGTADLRYLIGEVSLGAGLVAEPVLGGAEKLAALHVHNVTGLKTCEIREAELDSAG